MEALGSKWGRHMVKQFDIVLLWSLMCLTDNGVVEKILLTGKYLHTLLFKPFVSFQFILRYFLLAHRIVIVYHHNYWFLISACVILVLNVCNFINNCIISVLQR